MVFCGNSVERENGLLKQQIGVHLGLWVRKELLAGSCSEVADGKAPVLYGTREKLEG